MDYVGGDQSFASEILGLFLEQFPEYLKDLESTEGDWKARAHKAKGAARGIGAWNLAVLAERAERRPEPAQGSSERTAYLQDLRIRYDRLAQHLRDQGMID